jgi:hypothetical protein
MSELKPCPCGGVARLLYVNGESYGIHNGEKYTKVKCSSCSFSADDTDDWNARATGNEWISVDDALPELKDDSVVAHFKNGSIETVHIETNFKDITCGIDERGNQMYTKWYLSAGITHWMPLPAPPRG